MAYNLLSENMQGSCFTFLENGDDKREELFVIQPSGKIVKGMCAQTGHSASGQGVIKSRNWYYLTRYRES